ncbi:MAG: serine/threonine-protein kinase [Myxococcota bacterium]
MKPGDQRAARAFEGEVLENRYRLEALIGGGGMGAVYRARRLFDEQPVAIKMLLPRCGHDYAHQQRFAREARIAASIVHPNVVKMLDFGHTIDGRAFAVMEYLPGEDLRERVKRDGPLPWERARELLLLVIGGLQAAHDAGVLHRDIKPSNVFLVDGCEGQPNFVKLLDFGVAKAFDPESSLAEGLTLMNEVIGTVQYMAPERVRGDVADTRSDLYSVGVMAFYLLAGTLPRWGEGSPTKRLMRRINNPPPGVRGFVPEIPTAVDALIRCAMACDPRHRFSSLHEFAAAIESITVDGEPRRRAALPARPRCPDAPTRNLNRMGHRETQPQFIHPAPGSC